MCLTISFGSAIQVKVEANLKRNQSTKKYKLGIISYPEKMSDSQDI
jgi:hypothetical protein